MDIVKKTANELSEGKFVIINDIERENEADLVIAARYADENKLIFLMKHTCGIICVPMTRYHTEKLRLEPMVKNPDKKDICNYTISVDSINAKTGISARDHALVIKDLVSLNKENLVKPGHTFPLIANEKGVRGRQGHTEASIDLIKKARIYPEMAVICELIDRETGNALTGTKLIKFAKKNKITIITMRDIVNHFSRIRV